MTTNIGYWKLSANLSSIECTFGSTTCVGGFNNEFGNELCQVGYEGTLCNTCSSSLSYFDWITWKCSDCSTENYIAKFILLIPILIIIPGFIFSFMSMKSYSNINLHKFTWIESLKMVDMSYFVEKYYEESIYQLITTLKLLISSLQVCLDYKVSIPFS